MSPQLPTPGTTTGRVGSSQVGRDRRGHVVLVHESGEPHGTASRIAAHRPPGLLHSAISLVIINSLGQVLLQQRAPSKALFGGYWSNSCCTHPRPGEAACAAARRRAAEELGLSLDDVEEAGSFIYWAQDPSSSLVEFERDTVVTARSDATPRTDPKEVSDWEWIDPTAPTPNRPFTPWAPYVHGLAATSSLSRSAATYQGALR